MTATDAEKALRLRAEPPQVIRLSRRAILLLAVLFLTIAGGAIVFAMRKPAAKSPIKDLGGPVHLSIADNVARLPLDYSKQAPLLGPPLPGDLGRPILRAGVVGSAPSAIAQTTLEDQRLSRESDAARTSRLFVTISPVKVEDPKPLAVVPPVAGHVDPASDTDRHNAFMMAAPDKQIVSSDRLQTPISQYLLQAGSVIPAALETGLSSDLPGQVTARVTENVYDTVSGRFLLIPQGARVVGHYDAQVSFGQSRVLLAWTRLILPNGQSIVLDNAPGADVKGFAGLSDEVDNHWNSVLQGTALSTLLAVSAQSGASGNDSNILQALRSGASTSVNQAGQQAVGRSLNIRPTLTIRPGFPVRVLVTRDLPLAPYKEAP